MGSMMDAALSYIAQGFRVFPVKLDKKPITEHGLKDATQMQVRVKEFWSAYPSAGIGLVTDGLIVVDFDSKNGGKESKDQIETKYGKMPQTRTHRTGGGGLHYIYRNPNGRQVRNTVCLGGYKGVDIRANGGYIVVPPSPHPSGRKYEVLDNADLIPAPDWLIELTEVKNLTISSGDSGTKIPVGQNDQWLYQRACAYRGKGDTEELIFEKLQIDAQRLEQKPSDPYTDRDFRRIAKSSSRYTPNPIIPAESGAKISQDIVTQWIALTSGAFNVRQIWNELGVNDIEGKAYLRVILARLITSNIIAKTTVDGVYRRVENEKKLIDWENADPENDLKIKLPFDIHTYCKVYPKSIIIVAGSKNEGKTAFLMSCIMPNAIRQIVDFYNSETGPEQLKMRFTPLNIPSPAPFNVYERYDNFADVIEPDHLSIIDYLDMNSEVYLVGAEIDNIFRKLTTGCAIIGLQKPPPSVSIFKGIKKIIDRDLAYGGGFSAKRAVIYISLSSHKLKLVYVKTPVNPKLNPNNIMWRYDFDDNGYFTNIERYYPDEQDSIY